MSNLSRVVIIVWVFVVLILQASFTANLASLLTVQKLEPAFNDIQEIRASGHRVGYQEGSFVVEHLKSLQFDDSKIQSYQTPEQYAEALSKGSHNGGVAAIVDEIPYIRVFLRKYCSDYMMAGPIYKTNGFGFVSPTNHYIAIRILHLNLIDDLSKLNVKSSMIWVCMGGYDPGAN